MEVSRLRYFNTFYGKNVAGGKAAGSTGGYFAKYGETLSSGSEEEEQEKESLTVKQDNLKQRKTEVVKGNRLYEHLTGEDQKAPYYWLSNDGIINYKGVQFICDVEHNQLHLGDTSDKKNCLTIPLSKGGSLVVNRDNFDMLARAISMFSPEDVNLIMRAISEDAKARQMLEEIEDEKSSIGERISEGAKNPDAADKTQSEEEAAVVEEDLKEGDAAEGWKSTVYQSMTYDSDKNKD